MMIFKRNRMTDILLKGAPAAPLGVAAVYNGWIDSQIFLQWLI